MEEASGTSAPPPGTPRARSCREVTVSAVVFGIILGVVMNAAITYAGLKIGFTIVGSAIAAVLGFGVLRGLLRRGSILETNIAQTVATSVNTTNAGIIFTVPVLMQMGHRLDTARVEFWLITLACMAGRSVEGSTGRVDRAATAADRPRRTGGGASIVR